MKTGLRLVLIAALVGHLFLLFFWHPSFYVRHFFLIPAILIGMAFFRHHKRPGVRFMFTATAVLMFLLFSGLYIWIGKVPLLNLEPPGMHLWASSHITG